MRYTMSVPRVSRFGQFEVLSRLGVGGMGEVFRAKVIEKNIKIDVALKLIRPEFAAAPHFRKMFVAEAKIGALLRHPNIVRLVNFGEIDRALFLAMEYVEGVSLERLLADGPLPPSVAAHIATEILRALHYAHTLTVENRPIGIVAR